MRRADGVSTGACVGHVSPDAWAGGPVARLRDGDRVRLRIDTVNLEGGVDVVSLTPEQLAARPVHPDLRHDPRVPDDTRLWAALQAAAGGPWSGCVYDADRVAHLLRLGLAAERSGARVDCPATV